jgi:hypothetical protein
MVRTERSPPCLRFNRGNLSGEHPLPLSGPPEAASDPSGGDVPPARRDMPPQSIMNPSRPRISLARERPRRRAAAPPGSATRRAAPGAGTPSPEGGSTPGSATRRAAPAAGTPSPEGGSTPGSATRRAAPAAGTPSREGGSTRVGSPSTVYEARLVSSPSREPGTRYSDGSLRDSAR